MDRHEFVCIASALIASNHNGLGGDGTVVAESVTRARALADELCKVGVMQDTKLDRLYQPSQEEAFAPIAERQELLEKLRHQAEHIAALEEALEELQTAPPAKPEVLRAELDAVKKKAR